MPNTSLPRTLLGVGMLTIAYGLEAIANDPELRREISMRLSLLVKRVAQSQAEAWQKTADIAATSYNKARL